MIKIIFILTVCIFQHSIAADKIKMNFVNEELPVIIEQYSKESGTKFVIDSTVRGKITLLNSEKITLDEAYNQLSEALAINGFAIIKKDDYSVIRNARSAQRDGVEVYVNEVPGLRPQRMATWIVTLKYAIAKDVLQNIGRMVTSSYGELVINSDKNQLIITDFTSSLNKVAKMIQEIDKPAAVVKPAVLLQKAKKIEIKPTADAKAEDDKNPEAKKAESESEK